MPLYAPNISFTAASTSGARMNASLQSAVVGINHGVSEASLRKDIARLVELNDGGCPKARGTVGGPVSLDLAEAEEGDSGDLHEVGHRHAHLVLGEATLARAERLLVEEVVGKGIRLRDEDGVVETLSVLVASPHAGGVKEAEAEMLSDSDWGTRHPKSLL